MTDKTKQEKEEEQTNKQDIFDYNPETTTKTFFQKTLLISSPKTGKTELMMKLSSLPETDILVIDFENGSNYYKGKKANTNNLKSFRKLLKYLEDNEMHFKIIVLDSLTSINSGAGSELSIEEYNTTTKIQLKSDSNYDKISWGKGGTYLLDAVKTMLKIISKYCDHAIVLAHTDIKRKSDDGKIEGFDGLYIPDRLGTELTANFDNIGVLSRLTDDKTCLLSFSKQMHGKYIGARNQKITNKEFLVSQKREDGSLDVDLSFFLGDNYKNVENEISINN